MSGISAHQVGHIAQLSQIPITPQEEEALAAAFTETLEVVEELKKVATKGVEPAHHVTGLENVTRDDAVDEHQMLSQEEALSNAHQTHQGYIVVEQVLSSDA